MAQDKYDGIGGSYVINAQGERVPADEATKTASEVRDKVDAELEEWIDSPAASVEDDAIASEHKKK
jgi:hypothetical protein